MDTNKATITTVRAKLDQLHAWTDHNYSCHLNQGDRNNRIANLRTDLLHLIDAWLAREASLR